MHPIPAQRNPHIDLLRGLAIGAVMVLHFALAYGLKNSPLGLLPGWLLNGLAYNGNYGVTIFFVVSGFLITSNSLQRWGSLARIDARTFYVLRMARILPPLLLALAIIVVLGSAGLPYFSNTDGGHDLPASYFLLAAGSVLTFWHNVLMQSTGYFNYCLNIYWSLSVEEVFYLGMPLLGCILRRSALLIAFCLLVLIVGPAYRHAHVDNELYFMYGYLACFDAIAIGCLTALITPKIALGPRAAGVVRSLALLALGALLLLGIEGHEVFGFTFVALASAAFLLGAAVPGRAPLRSGMAGRALQWFGRHSYELYLFHIIVLALMRTVQNKVQLTYHARLPWMLLFFMASTLLAALVARYLAEPANAALRRRFLPRNTRQSA